VAKTLVFFANTARYTFKVYDLGTTYQSFDFLPPLEVNVADWDIAYQPLDNTLPGVVPSVCTTRFYLDAATPSIEDFRTIFKTAEPEWLLEVHEGLNVVWRGFITPDLGEIEVRNGKRFIKVVASDGFQMLAKKADYFTDNSSILPFTDIIATVFTFCGFSYAFEDGYYVSEHFNITNSTTGYTNQGGLWITGTPRDGLIFDENEARSSREIIDSICTTFNLQLFQDKGSLVFRSCHIKTPAWYNYYDTGGDFIGRITPPASTQGITVFTDGTEMYRPAISECRIRHPYSGSSIIWYRPGNQIDYDNTAIGNPVSDGTTEIDFNGTLRIRYTLPPNFPPTVSTFELHLTFQYDGFYWDGAAWTKTPSFVTFTLNTLVENPNPFETVADEFYTVHNYKMTDIPALGSQPFYFTVDAVQTAGTDVGPLISTSTAIFEYKAGAPEYIIYIADNTSRVNGVTLDLNTFVADIRQEPVSGSFTVLPSSIRYWPATRTGNGLSNAFWDAEGNEIVELVSQQITRKAFRTQQYYEIELDGNISYNHTLTWDGVDYKPVNLTMAERSTRVTYREFIDGDLIPAVI
jgi:hypothetical protein